MAWYDVKRSWVVRIRDNNSSVFLQRNGCHVSDIEAFEKLSLLSSVDYLMVLSIDSHIVLPFAMPHQA